MVIQVLNLCHRRACHTPASTPFPSHIRGWNLFKVSKLISLSLWCVRPIIGLGPTRSHSLSLSLFVYIIRFGYSHCTKLDTRMFTSEPCFRMFRNSNAPCFVLYARQNMTLQFLLLPIEPPRLFISTVIILVIIIIIINIYHQLWLKSARRVDDAAATNRSRPRLKWWRENV